jgi:hypothetical protein
MAAKRVLDRIASLKTKQGTISGWGFCNDKPAFTHTIAYTLRGLIESAYILNQWHPYGTAAEDAIERLIREAELRSGRLAGAYHTDWRPIRTYSCLTGNAQIAICLLRLDQKRRDLRLVNSAAKLVDYVCSKQLIRCAWRGLRGAVSGSSPIWGRYMTLRYPNWAAKYHADALIMLRDRISQIKVCQ